MQRFFKYNKKIIIFLLAFFILLAAAPETLQAQKLPELIPYRKGDLWGYCDSNKKIFIEPKYYWVDTFNGNYAKIRVKLSPSENSTTGMIDKTGKEIIKPKYYDVKYFNDGRTWVMHNNGKEALFDDRGKKLTWFRFDHTYSFEDGFALVELNNSSRWFFTSTAGLINKQGKTIVPIKYHYVGYYNEYGFAIGYREEKKVAFYTLKGRRIIGRTFSDGEYFSEGLMAVKKWGKWGFINPKGKTVIPFKYLSVGSFKDGMAMVETKSGHGFINKQGNEIVPPQYESILLDYNEGFAAVKKGDYWGFINNQGKIVAHFKYSEVENFKDGIAKVKYYNDTSGYGYGFIDTTGKEIVPPFYDEVGKMDSLFIRVKNNGKYGFFNLKGKEIVPVVCDYEIRFSENICWAKINGILHGFDNTGNIIFSPGKYKGAHEFHEGLSAVTSNGYKWGFINKEGKVVIPFIYDEVVEDFNNGLSRVVKDKKRGVINKYGEIVIPITFDGVGELNNGIFTVCIDRKCGFYYQNGVQITEIKYQGAVDQFKNAYISKIRINGKEGYIDRKGNEYYEEE